MVLVGLPVSDWNLSLLWAYKPVILGVSSLLGEKLSPDGTWVWRAVPQGKLQCTEQDWKDPFPSFSTVPVSFGFLTGPTLASY